MSARIRNRSNHLVVVTLNTRVGLYVAPGELSRELHDFEIQNNPQVEKLRRNGMIQFVERTSAEPQRHESQRRAPHKTRK